jgi:serine/threonine protein kinase
MLIVSFRDFSELPPHPNVVQFYGVSIDGPQPIIVLEYCAEGSLDVLLFDRGIKLPPEEKIKLVEGIAKGMFHLHKHNIVHRDLAARNILLSETREPKISVHFISHSYSN